MEYHKEGKIDILQFKDYHEGINVPFVIYADFETFACKIDTCLPNPNMASTTHQMKYEACGYGYQVVCTNDNYTKPSVVYRGDNIVDFFFMICLKKRSTIMSSLQDPEELVTNEKPNSKILLTVISVIASLQKNLLK